ncbi:MAG: UMP kinase [Candidatus Magasanikbacteria bacterium CG_4_10_14_0_8_um_filter_32_14]|uniref:UMP kinase n=1 Tax=Candidatus Magasanikbacteria bacterium CG_4_10_14_0_8_um_filter_32_14 TaxID=1974640 RepID=A0A2M7R9F2_9BACT|nr:MAG: UMP kinase [Candidatus Magasanikbacteria bacterium CG_4_10_14_0_8_um_filter_32_14]
MSNKNNIKIISVGGSIIIPKTGFDTNFLKKFRQLILSEVAKGQKFVLIIGGGNTARMYQSALREIVKLKDIELDWMGIGATIINANFVRLMFGEFAYKEVVTNPTKKVKTNRPIIVVAGYKPGCSTDYDAVLLAKAYGAKEIFNLSNIEYVYDKDPREFIDAKKVENIDWETFRKEIVGDIWKPGKSAPFDPVASKLAEKMKLKVSILQGTNLLEVKKALEGKKFKGSVIE